MEFRIATGATVAAALKAGSAGPGSKAPVDDSAYSWEKAYERSWEAVEEDESGLIRTEALERARRAAQQRKQASEASGVVQGMRVQRGMLRHVFLVLDMSRSMLATDIKPSRAVAVARAAQEFAAEFFDQNPISSLGLIVAKRGIAEKVGDLSANRDRCIRLIAQHCGLAGLAGGATDAALTAASAGVCEGEFSLQTCLEIGYRALQLVPPYGSREILVVHGSHSSVDPGNILNTIQSCKAARITVSFISLPGEVFIATKCAAETGGRWAVPEGYDSLRTHALGHCVPPPKKRRARQPGDSADGDNDNDDIERARSVAMGFPKMLGEAGGLDVSNNSNGNSASGASSASASNYAVVPCACHGEIRSNVSSSTISAAITDAAAGGATSGGGYICPRCDAKLCDLPCSCAVCGLQLISAARLARSYHHLFPVPPFVEVRAANEPTVLGRPGDGEEGGEGEGDGAVVAASAAGMGDGNDDERALMTMGDASSSAGSRPLSAAELKARQQRTAAVVSRYLPLGTVVVDADESAEVLVGAEYDEVQVQLPSEPSLDATIAAGITASVETSKGTKKRRASKAAATVVSKRVLRLPLVVADDSPCCCGCGIGIHPRASRFVCLACRSAYCSGCDVLIHETLHNCPGCC